MVQKMVKKKKKLSLTDPDLRVTSSKICQKIFQDATAVDCENACVKLASEGGKDIFARTHTITHKPTPAQRALM